VDDNPYQAPTTDDLQQSPPQPPRKLPRPLGVSILAMLHVIGGVLLFGVQLYLVSLLADFDPPRGIRITPPLIIARIVFFCSILIASGIGMWRGAAWGWWLAGFYHFDGVYLNVITLAMVMRFTEALGDSMAAFETAGYLGRLAVHFLILHYFFRRSVLAYFALDRLNKYMAIGIFFGACVAFSVLAVAAGYLAAGE
jgi:hypothetical protein